MEKDYSTKLSLRDFDQIYSSISKEIEKEGSFDSAFPLASSFYFTVSKDVSTSLPANFYFLLHKEILNQIGKNNEDFIELYPRSLNFYHSIKNMIKEDDGTISTDDERTAEKLAKKGINVKLRKEQEDEIETPTEEQGIPSQALEKLGETIQSVLLEGLRNVGEEITSSTHTASPPNQVTVNVQFKNKEEETWTFEVRDNDKLVLIGSIPEEVLADVEVLPSGEVRINKPVLIDSMSNYLNKSYISEEEDPDMEPDAHATKNYDDVEAGVLEKIAIGHMDNEPGMMKQAAHEIIEYGQKLYDLFELHDSLDQQVDYPHWFQSLVIRGRDYIGKAGHYLEFQHNELISQPEPVHDPRQDKIRHIAERACKMEIINERELNAINKACEEGLYELATEYLKKKMEMTSSY